MHPGLFMHTPEDAWFAGSTTYWSRQDASVDGMLGGLGSLHDADVRDSVAFIGRFLPLITAGEAPKATVALDVGAGIGRVSENVLLRFTGRVAILEADERFVAQARERLGDRLVHAYAMRMQQLPDKPQPSEPCPYDFVWVQWVLMYASDAEVVRLLRALHARLADKAKGYIGVKENVKSSTGADAIDVDSSDCSIVRTPEHFRRVFAAAGMRVVAEAVQTGFPRHLYSVHMFMLQAVPQ